MQIFQQTLKQSLEFRGIGVHSGAETILTLRPAPADHGIIFIRRDAAGAESRIAAVSVNSRPADLCTALAASDAPAALRVEMVEHLMAALAGCGVDNAVAELSAAEVPVLDGSASAYAAAFQRAGLARQSRKRRYLRVLKPVRVRAAKGDGYAEFLPGAAGDLCPAGPEIASIINRINEELLVPVSMEGLQAVLGAGRLVSAAGKATGAGRAQKAAKAAIAALPQGKAALQKAKALLISVNGGRDMGLKEINAAANLVQEAAPAAADIILAAGIDAKLDGFMRLSLIAAEAGEAGAPQAAPLQLFDIEIDFTARAPQTIGRQRLGFALTPQFFSENLAPFCTFGFYAEAEQLRAAGMARGSSLENSVVLDAAGAVMNPARLGRADGFVRHKALDAVGDTALLGAPFLGLFRSFKGGHRLNGAVVRALLADKTAWEIAELA